MKPFLSFASALPLAMVSASSVLAGAYSGNWPITVAHSQHTNGTYCLTIKDDGSIDWPHSGYGSFSIPGDAPLFATFQLIDHLLTVTVEAPGLTGQNAGLVFVAPAGNGTIGKGIYDEVYGGEESDSGIAVFGPKNSC